MYVLDEPSTGLHPADNEKLLDSLKRLRDAGNSVIVVEHDEDTIRSADYLIDMGPGSRRIRGRGHRLRLSERNSERPEVGHRNLPQSPGNHGSAEPLTADRQKAPDQRGPGT